MLELELCSEKVTRERDTLRERLQALETGRQELADEYIILKSNYLALGNELEQEVRQAAAFPTPPHSSLIYGSFVLRVHITAQVQGGLSAVRQGSLAMGLFSGLRNFMYCHYLLAGLAEPSLLRRD